MEKNKNLARVFRFWEQLFVKMNSEKNIKLLVMKKIKFSQ